MITSMTGFGSAEKISDKYSLKVEIKTLNSKFFDASFRLPREFVKWEIEIKNLLENGLGRGKINLGIDFNIKHFDQLPIQINQNLFDAYYQKLVEVSNSLGVNGSIELFKMAFNMPNVVQHQDEATNYITYEELKSVLEMALSNCNEFRANEGARLEAALLESRLNIELGLEEVKKLDSGRIQNLKTRIHTALKEIKDKVKVDENRFEQELIYYIEKLDLTEEKIRLASHLTYFDEVIADPLAPSGKKLGFLAQELGREINTIGSKANDAGIQRAVIGMKEELEKIKEQILNIL